MVNNLKSKILQDLFSFIDPKVEILVPVQVMENNRLVSRSEFQVVDISEALSRFTSDDFSVNSLRSVGAFDTLKSVFMSPVSSMNIADSFDNINLAGDGKSE